MPVRAEVVLDDQERETLERWARRPKSSQALAFRCRIVLAAAEGRSSTEIAAELGTTGTTVGRWRGRFARRGLDGLHVTAADGAGRPWPTDACAWLCAQVTAAEVQAAQARQAQPGVALSPLW